MRVDVDAGGRALEIAQRVGGDDRAKLRRRRERALDDGQLVAEVRVVDDHLHHEAVDLRLRERVRPLSLDRVLRREDEERVGDRVGGRTDRHLALLHDLEERRLHLGGSAVDLVGEEEVAEHGPELDVEVARAGR